jgi:hypothetical protein
MGMRVARFLTTGPDLLPEPGVHATFARIYEYKRHGMVSLVAGIDLLTGKVHALVRDPQPRPRVHRLPQASRRRFPASTAIKLIFDNHFAHIQTSAGGMYGQGQISLSNHIRSVAHREYFRF